MLITRSVSLKLTASKPKMKLKINVSVVVKVAVFFLLTKKRFATGAKTGIFDN